jgi:hypothetical protein
MSQGGDETFLKKRSSEYRTSITVRAIAARTNQALKGQANHEASNTPLKNAKEIQRSGIDVYI